MDLVAELNDLRDLRVQRAMMKKYLDLKIRVEDWHGVADAAMDLREIDAKLSILQRQVGNGA